jgi:tetratricopeptide (TPR) repeat protein
MNNKEQKMERKPNDTFKEFNLNGENSIEISFPCNNCGKIITEKFPLPTPDIRVENSSDGMGWSDKTMKCPDCPEEEYAIKLGVDQSQVSGIVYVEPAIDKQNLHVTPWHDPNYKRMPTIRRFFGTLVFFTVVFSLLSAGQASAQSGDWHKEFRDTFEYVNNYMFGYNLGMSLMTGNLPSQTGTGRSSADNDVLSYIYKGGDCAKLRDYDGAISNFTKALNIDSSYADIHYVRGFCYVMKGDYNRAIPDLTRAITIDPNSADYYQWRAISYIKTGNYARAIADYTQQLRIAPNNAATYSNRGAAYNVLRNYDSAIVDYTQAIRLNPNDAASYRGRGDAYSNKGDYDRAIADYSQVLRINPNITEAYCNRGYAYYQKRDYQRAKADFAEAEMLEPGLATAEEGLALLKKKGY